MIEPRIAIMLRKAGVFPLFLCSTAALGQTQASPPAFEVADVKINKSGEVRMAVDMQGGGRLTMRNVTMKVMRAPIR